MKEKVKSYILLMLVIVSIVQIGILLNYESHGFPFNFIKSFLSGDLYAPDIDSMAREEYFLPFRIIASNGNESHWIIGKNTPAYNELWNEARFYLKQALESGKSIAPPEEDWGTLVTKRGFVFEFKSGINSELLKWFLDIDRQASLTGISSLHKIMIIAGLYGQNEIYILDGSKVYRYAPGTLAKKQDENIFENALLTLEKDEKNNPFTYMVIREVAGKSQSLSWINPDILCVTAGYDLKYRKYRRISYSVPDGLKELDDVADVIFEGNEKDSFDSYINPDGSKVFMNLDNIYKIHNNGFLEYRYVADYTVSEKGSVQNAFVKALEFIDRVKRKLNLEADIYITNISEAPAFYQFTFDYMAEGIPVYIEFTDKGKNVETIGNAIVVKANEKRILGCRWLLKDIGAAGPWTDYNLHIDSILNSTALKDRMNSIKSARIVDMGVSYLVDADSGRNKSPVWAIETGDGGKYFINLQTRQGE